MLVEDAVNKYDLKSSSQRYQLAIDEGKVRLNLAVCQGAQLLPGKMVINTSSVVDYNNNLQTATAGFHLGINDQTNKETKKVGLKPMDGGP